LPSKHIPNFEHSFCDNQTIHGRNSDDKTNAKENHKRCHFGDVHCCRLHVSAKRALYILTKSMIDMMGVESSGW
jgi:hypothetical protein